MQDNKGIKNFGNSKAITLIEVILVMALIMILAAGAAPFASNFVTRNNFDTTSDMVISSIRKAQSYAIDNKDSGTWGVCYYNDSIRLYEGSCNSPNFNEDYVVPSSVSVSGLSDTTFSKGRGEPSALVSVSISSRLDSQTIEVNEAGGMDIN